MGMYRTGHSCIRCNLEKAHEELKKADTLTNYNERPYSCYQLENGERKLGEIRAFLYYKNSD